MAVKRSMAQHIQYDSELSVFWAIVRFAMTGVGAVALWFVAAVFVFGCLIMTTPEEWGPDNLYFRHVYFAIMGVIWPVCCYCCCRANGVPSGRWACFVAMALLQVLDYYYASRIAIEMPFYGNAMLYAGFWAGDKGFASQSQPTNSHV